MSTYSAWQGAARTAGRWQHKRMDAIESKDIRIDTGRSRDGSFIRITHTPTGTVVERNPIRGDLVNAQDELLTQLHDMVSGLNVSRNPED